jgi:hypothetical protein
MRCQRQGLQCGSVRISSVVCERLKQCVKVSSILYFILSCVNGK